VGHTFGLDRHRPRGDFGPVLGVSSADRKAQAIAMANHSIYRPIGSKTGFGPRGRVTG
jgi:hypothetical protein